MKYLLSALLSAVLLLPVPVTARELTTLDNDDLQLSPEVDFVSAGPWLNEQQTHYRVILLRAGGKARILLQKIFLANLGQKGQIKWSRQVDFGRTDPGISSKEFIESFRWHSPTSFSFRALNSKYILKDISRSRPQLKEMDSEDR